MKENMFMKYFKTGYIFLYDWQATMGLYFASYVGMYLIFEWIIGRQPLSLITIDSLTTLQMLVVSIIIGLIHPVLVPRKKYTNMRTFCWVVLTSIISIAAAFVLDWFGHMPVWCMITYIISFILGTFCMWLAIYWNAQRETKELNEGLSHFKAKSQKRRKKDEHYKG